MDHQNQIAEVASVLTQPAVYTVGGFLFLGVSIADWILIGTGVLLVMNLGFAASRLYHYWREKHGSNKT